VRGRQRARRAETISIPAERDLTIYVDKRELVTLMTLGAHPEWLVLGYLRNQRLVESGRRDRIGDRGLGGRRRRRQDPHGIDRIEERTAQRVVTTGCGQGSVFGA
jgi:FdhD protein